MSDRLALVETMSSNSKKLGDLFLNLYPQDLFLPVTDEINGFNVSVVNATPLPQTTEYMGLHQCYSSTPVTNVSNPDENRYGNVVVDKLLKGNRGHYSPLEHASITLSLGYFPHSVYQQLLRSRIGVSPSVQSFRYTSQHIIDVYLNKLDVEQVIYLRQPGFYYDRESKYEYTEANRNEDLSLCKYVVKHVGKRLTEGMPPEQARGMLNFDYRQHAIITLNTRSAMGILDRRAKKDAQHEIQILANMIFKIMKIWQPQVFEWYEKNRLYKGVLAP